MFYQISNIGYLIKEGKKWYIRTLMDNLESGV